MSENYKDLSMLLYKEDFESYSFILETIDLKKIEPVVMVCLLRLSYVRRDRIETWKSFLKESHRELSLRGLNADSILIGL